LYFITYFGKNIVNQSDNARMSNNKGLQCPSFLTSGLIYV